jgi:rubredoxin
VVEKNEMPKELESIKIRDTYNVLYAKNFDPNTKEYIVLTQDVDKQELPLILIELSKKYFEELGNTKSEISITSEKKEIKEHDVHQCTECLSLYNSEYGDVTQGIEKGILFKDLQDDYHCFLCESPKNKFINFLKKV